jgi:hypothetical protein
MRFDPFDTHMYPVEILAILGNLYYSLSTGSSFPARAAFPAIGPHRGQAGQWRSDERAPSAPSGFPAHDRFTFLELYMNGSC